MPDKLEAHLKPIYDRFQDRRLQGREDARLAFTADIRRVIGTMTEKPTECHWTYDADEESWNGTCGIKWYIPHESTPEENDMNYCPKCGGKLVVVPTEDEQSYMVADNQTGGIR